MSPQKYQVPFALALVLASRAMALPSLELDPRWPATGVTLSAYTYNGDSLVTLPDDDGGMFFAWQDVRGKLSCCRSTPDIYAQRLGADGRKRWGSNDLAVCTWGGMWGGEDVLAGLVPDGRRGVVVTWIHRDGPDGTFAQRVGADGDLRWSSQGATVFNAESGIHWKLTGRTVLHGGAWLATDGPNGAAPGVRRADSGVEPWCAGPETRLDAASAVREATLLPGRAADSVLAVWVAAEGAGLALRARGIPGGAAKDALGRHAFADVLTFDAVTDGTGGAVVLWERIGTDGDRALMLQRASTAGEPMWGEGVVIGHPAGPGSRTALAAATGGLAGVLWAGPRDADPARLVTVDGRGHITGAAEGEVVAERVMPGRRLVLAPSRSGWLVGWVEPRPDNAPAVMCALLRPSGGSASVTVESRPGLTTDWERLAPLDPSHAMLVWKDDRNGGYPNVVCVRRISVLDEWP